MLREAEKDRCTCYIPLKRGKSRVSYDYRPGLQAISHFSLRRYSAFYVYKHQLLVKMCFNGIFIVAIDAHFEARAQISLVCTQCIFREQFRFPMERFFLFTAPPGNASGCSKFIHARSSCEVETEANTFGVAIPTPLDASEPIRSL